MGKEVHFSVENEGLISYEFSRIYGGSDNSLQRKRLARVLLVLAKQLCSKREYEVLMRALGGERQREIAQSLGLNKSTVSRHLHRGLEKIHAVSDIIYSFYRSELVEEDGAH